MHISDKRRKPDLIPRQFSISSPEKSKNKDSNYAGVNSRLTDVNYYIFICGKKLHMLNYKNKN
jgi:hypothetical protein